MGVLSIRISLLQRGSKIKEISDISSNILDLTKVVLFLVLLAFSSQKSSRCRTGIMLDYKIDQTLDFESVTEISGSSVQIKLPFGDSDALVIQATTKGCFASFSSSLYSSKYGPRLKEKAEE